LLKSFFHSRGINCTIDSAYLSNFIFSGLNFLFLEFLRSDFYVTSIFNSRDFKFYKIKLKLLLKTSFNKQIIEILLTLNSEIVKWLEDTCFFQKKKKIALKLDLYVYKLLWRHLKKRYPKKTNTWIYFKYWGNFSGLWKFFVVDYTMNKFIFLKSHFFLLENTRITTSKIYNSLYIFNLYNKRKLYEIIFKKFEYRYYLSNYSVLYGKQKGLCFICTNPLYLKNFKILYFRKNSEKLFQNLIIVHTYCSF
jgi:hypothetical protein